MDPVTLLAGIGAAISLIGTGRYVVGIIKEGTRPRLSSWIAWFAANIVFTIMAFTNDAYLAAAFNALAAAGNGTVLLVSALKRRGERPAGQTDWLCLAAAGACLVLIVLLPGLSLLGALLGMTANAVATWPTIQHAWQEPFAETWHLFAGNAGASLLGLVGVSMAGGVGLVVIAGPLMATAGNVVLLSVTLGRRYGGEIGREIEAEVAELQEELQDVVRPAESPAID